MTELCREEVEIIAKAAAHAAIQELFAEYGLKPHHFVYIVARYEQAKNRMTWREKAAITALVTFLTVASLGLLTTWAKDQAAQYADRHITPPRTKEDQG